MKAYNPKQWLQILVFVQKNDTIIRLAPLLAVTFIYTLGVAYFELEYLKLSQQSWVKNIPVMHGLLSFVISLLLVFRTNTAYDRWWEGRKHLGSLVNNSRNLAIKIAAMVPNDDQKTRTFFRESIPKYAFVLKDHLQDEQTQLSLDEEEHPEFDSLVPHNHVPNQVAYLMIKKVQNLYEKGTISGDQFIILNGELASFTDICGACERIKNTPIPFSYSSFIKKFILLYVLSLPLGYVFSLGYYAAPIVTFIFYVLASLELIAEEIEEPFGTDPNDLPMQKIAENIKKHVAELL